MVTTSVRPIPAALKPLVSYLESLTERATVEDLRRILQESPVTIDDVQPWVQFDPVAYRRNLVCQGTWYEILVICWLSGQRSPIHNHAGSTCGVRVLQGTCTETIFDFSPCGQVKARESHDMTAGDVCATQDQDTHQISNLQGEGDNLVTLHIYSPPLRKMDQFSLTGREVGVYRPVVFEHSWGSGI